MGSNRLLIKKNVMVDTISWNNKSLNVAEAHAVDSLGDRLEYI